MKNDEDIEELKQVRQSLQAQKTWFPIVVFSLFAVFGWLAGASSEPLALLLIPVAIVLAGIVVLLLDIRLHLLRVEISELKKEHWEEHERELWAGDQ